jgi:hypothetical protein
VWCREFGQQAQGARIVHDLEPGGVNLESGTLVELQRLRVIEVAGMQPQPLDWLGKGERNRLTNEPLADPAPDLGFDQSEVDDLGMGGVEFQLQQADVAMGVNNSKRVAFGRCKVGCQLSG